MEQSPAAVGVRKDETTRLYEALTDGGVVGLASTAGLLPTTSKTTPSGTTPSTSTARPSSPLAPRFSAARPRFPSVRAIPSL